MHYRSVLFMKQYSPQAEDNNTVTAYAFGSLKQATVQSILAICNHLPTSVTFVQFQV